MASTKNTLSEAISPYLLQHAENPVHWFEWGDEAFAEARKQDKPVFLSIGYATCHWCHVMAHESFEDKTVAELMNKAFINIKVDREERPDIDNTYMHVCQMLTGRGGWPLTIVMTPEKKPFYAATYIPKSGRQGQPGMMELIPRLSHMWNEKREKILGSAREIMQAFQQSIEPQSSHPLSTNILENTFSTLQQQFDSAYGGFGGSPKFPTPHTLTFLLRYGHVYEEKESQSMVEQTLTQMRYGGLFDQVGGGFHRYSTDSKWLLPHFEKMLYDQAMHLLAYTEGWQALKNPLFKQTANKIAAYLLRDLQHADGAFYSAEDADSEGDEGTFYVWSVDEVRDILPAADAELAIEIFNMKAEGNYADESTGRSTGKNILNLSKPLAELAEERDIDTDKLRQKLESVRQQLFRVRERRERPFLDDKILTDWNGLTIAALARTGRALEETEYIKQAERAAAFIFEHLRQDDGRLLHRYRNKEAAIPGTADDYAFLIWGLLELYESTFQTRYLNQAISLQQTFLDSHWDETYGDFFFTSEESEELMGRKKEYFDSALPSGNSVAAMNLLRLGRLTATPDWEGKADQIMESASETAERSPTSFTQLLQAQLWAVESSFEIVIAGPAESSATKSFFQHLDKVYEPHKIVLLNDPSDDTINQIAPYTQRQTMQNAKPTAYVCRNYACNEPTSDPRKMVELIRNSSGEQK